MNRRVATFLGVMVIAGIVLWSLFRMHGLVLLAPAFIVACVLALRVPAPEKEHFGDAPFLCDSCKYNHPSTCSIPERSNAEKCADYRRRGT